MKIVISMLFQNVKAEACDGLDSKQARQKSSFEG